MGIAVCLIRQPLQVSYSYQFPVCTHHFDYLITCIGHTPHACLLALHSSLQEDQISVASSVA